LLAACVTTEVDPPKPRPKPAEPIPTDPAQALLDFVAHSVLLFKEDVGRLPVDLGELQTKPADTPGWRGPYVDGPPLDVWKRPITYLLTATGFKVISAGLDGEPGTRDDLTSP
jgi:hypothetical protein